MSGWQVTIAGQKGEKWCSWQRTQTWKSPDRGFAGTLNKSKYGWGISRKGVCKMRKQISQESKPPFCVLNMPSQLQPQGPCILCFPHWTHVSFKNPHGSLSHFIVAYAQMSPNQRDLPYPLNWKYHLSPRFLEPLSYIIFPHSTYNYLLHYLSSLSPPVECKLHQITFICSFHFCIPQYLKLSLVCYGCSINIR